MALETRKFIEIGRKLQARALRSSVFTLLLPCGIGLILTAWIGAWVFGSLATIRDQTKRDIYIRLKLAESQVYTTFSSRINQLSEASLFRTSNVVKNIRGPHYADPAHTYWTFERDVKQLTSDDGRSVRLNSLLPEKPKINLTSDEFAVYAWQQLQDSSAIATNAKDLRRLANLSLVNGGADFLMSVPIFGKKGELLGIVCTSTPANQIDQFLPDNTFLVEPSSSSVIGREKFPLTADAKAKLLKGEVVPNELSAASRRIPLTSGFSTWKLWNDHPVSELWSKKEVRRTFNFGFSLVAILWLFIAFITRTAKKARNRQRRLIGSLVRKVIWITDENGAVDYVLGKITGHLGWKEVDYLNVDIGLFVHPSDRPKLMQAIRNAQSLVTRDEILEIRFENKDREYRWYEVSVSNMMEVPEINGIVISAHDIELRKHATDHIIASKRAAEKANEAKSEFLSRMSHELRTPLNAILGFGQLLEMEAITDRQAENLNQILVAGRHLLNLVNDILDIARIETRKVNLSVERVNLREVLEESFALLGPLASKSNIKLTLDEGQWPDVWSDRQRLKQVVLNLISNGIKYNNLDGNVTVSVIENEEGVKLLVSDNGIGIESHYLDRVFTPFDRLGSDNPQVEGSGLGLALSKTLVEAMGATLEVQSEYGKGSVFTICFRPSAIVREDVQENHSDSNNLIFLDFENSDFFKILLIEDNIVNLRYVSKVVEKMPHVTLISAKEGGIGIEMARAHNPDLILLDLDLPDLHGHDVLRSLRSDEKTKATRIVVMSAETNPHIIEVILASGANEFVTKPVDVNSLISLFSEERNAA